MWFKPPRDGCTRNPYTPEERFLLNEDCVKARRATNQLTKRRYWSLLLLLLLLCNSRLWVASASGLNASLTFFTGITLYMRRQQKKKSEKRTGDFLFLIVTYSTELSRVWSPSSRRGDLSSSSFLIEISNWSLRCVQESSFPVSPPGHQGGREPRGNNRQAARREFCRKWRNSYRGPACRQCVDPLTGLIC